MKLWIYVTEEGQAILLHAPVRKVALRRLNLMLKQGVTPEDTALVEIPKLWWGRLLGAHEDAVADSQANEDVPMHYANDAQRIAGLYIKSLMSSS